jgi:dihydrofolate reductase
MIKLCLIVAIGDNGEIGQGNKLPWSVKGDLKHFKELTMGVDNVGHPCVMGRLTWESLPPSKLPGRKCLVLSSTPIDHPNALVVKSVEEAIQWAKDIEAKKLFIIGGSRLFNEYAEQCDVHYITNIHGKFPEADTYFRPLHNPKVWRSLEYKVHTLDDIAWSTTTWVKH